jgi:hypothetical protein
MNIFTERYVWYRARLDTSTQANRLLGIMKRARAANFNAFVLQESVCLRAATSSSACTTNLNAVKAEAQKLGLGIIPASFSQGEPVSGSPGKDIREAYPILDTKFQRSGSTALCVPDPPVTLVNGDFNGNATGWIVDKLGTVVFVDTAVKHSGVASMRVQNPAGQGNIRLYQAVTVVPWRAYKISFWVRTEQFSIPSKLRVLVIGGNGRYTYQNRDYGMGAAPPSSTQDWTQYVIDVPSLENTKLQLYLVSTSSATGKVWWDEVKMQECGLYSMIRRPATPITVKSYDKTKTYKEGTDYVVGTERLTIPTGSTIPSGASLKVSWFQRADNYELWQIPASPQEPEFYTVLEANAKLIQARLTPNTWMMLWDEWRAGNWQKTPAGATITAGQMLAEVQRRSEALLRKLNPHVKILVWGDMFDDFHNGKPNVIYMGMNGFLNDAKKGLGPDTCIMTWFNNGNTNSLRMWSALGQEQCICGYYENKDNPAEWNRILKLAEAEATPVTKVNRFMYTTWITGQDGGIGEYKDLEYVAAYWKGQGRWPT